MHVVFRSQKQGSIAFNITHVDIGSPGEQGHDKLRIFFVDRWNFLTYIIRVINYRLQ